jgi:hypothetical protein
MKTFAIVLGGLALAVVLVAAGLWAGAAWAQGRWDSSGAGYGPMGRTMMAYGWDDESIDPAQDVPCNEGWQEYGMMGGARSGAAFDSIQDMPCEESWQGYGMGGYGMMAPDKQCPVLAEGAGSDWDWSQMPCSGAYSTPGEGEILSLEEAETAVHGYVERLGYTGLEVTEVMEFERNFYAILAEEDSGIGAMEVLVDKASGAVGPEHGPNMMWNAKYGMHRGGRMGMMGGYGYATSEMTISSAEAEEIAQQWLDANFPGRTAGEADEFYGYYTLHFLNDGQIEGMLSVHGSSGDVWYHSWHGDFVTMTEGHG